MNELDLVRRIRPDRALPTAEDLAPARDQLAAALRSGAAPAQAFRPRRRLVWGGAAVGLAAAAAVTAVLTLVPTGGAPTDHRGDARPVSAGFVLDRAAQTALHRPAGTPRADQFIYQKLRSSDGTWDESWSSVDGTRDGYYVGTERACPPRRAGTTPKPCGPPRRSAGIFPGCRNGRAAVTRGGKAVPGKTEPCVPEARYRPDLPATTDGMLAYLRAHRTAGTDASAMSEDIGELAGLYLTPRQSAALFGAMRRLPGMRLVAHATDGAGRDGVGIAWGHAPGDVFVFDRTDYAFLGTSTGGTVALAVVDAVGQRS